MAKKRNKPVPFPLLWLRDHLAVVYIAVGALLILAIFLGISIYKNANHPLTKFISASAKDFNASFTFELEATKDGAPVMRYTGAYQADPDHQNLKAVYDADYGDYTYTGAVYAEDDTRISGNLYDGKWRVHDCTEKVLNFFDFNTDYRKGSFDSASFLRFTELTSRFSADELGKFLELFKSRMDGSTSLAKVETVSQDGAKVYSYEIDTTEFFNLVRDKGASIFFNALHYDAFCAMYEANQKSVGQSKCTFRFTVSDDGWLTDFRIALTTGGTEYAVSCTMDNFGAAEVNIPEEFFEAEVREG